MKNHSTSSHMRRLLKVCLFAAVFCMVFALSAFALTEGDYEYSIANNEAKITKYIGAGGDIVIPEKIRGCTVVEIGDGAFKSDWKRDATITSVVLPDTIRKIGSYAFMDQNVESFNFPASIEEIGPAVFWNCNLQGTLVIPAKAANAMKRNSWYIGQQFHENKYLEAVVFEEGTEFIIGGMFSGCTSLESVTIPSTVTEIRADAFNGCTSLREVVIPASVTLIGKNAFDGCTSLEKVTFAPGSKLETIEANAFQYTAIKNIYLPNTLKTLGQFAFNECSKLTGLVIPANVKSIYDSIFWSNCDSLMWVCVSETTKVGEYVGWLNGAPNAIVYCEAGSSAEKSCINRDYSYISDSSASAPIQVIYNGERVAFGAYGANPQIINDRTMVPLRSIFEAMGASVEWDGATRTVTSTRGSVTVKLTIDGTDMIVNGRAVKLDSPAVIRSDRTLVPVRAIAEAFGAGVDWNANGKLVIITE